MKKRVLSLVLAVAMVATLAIGCGSKDKGSADTDKKAETQLAVQIGPNPETIDPALNSAVDGGNMIQLYPIIPEDK